MLKNTEVSSSVVVVLTGDLKPLTEMESEDVVVHPLHDSIWVRICFSPSSDLSPGPGL